MKIIEFPGGLSHGRPLTLGASAVDIAIGRLRVLVGAALRLFRVPGVVRDAQITDGVSGQHIAISTGSLFTKITVNGRDYYFDRFTGRFDGTGLGCR